MEPWRIEVKNGEGFDVEIEEDTYLVLSKVYLKEIKESDDESIYLHISADDGNKFVVGNFNPSQKQQQLNIRFDKSFTISHTLRDESVHLYGTLYDATYPDIDTNLDYDPKKEEANIPSECAHICKKFMKLEFWGSEIKSSQPLDVKVDGGRSLHLRQVCLSVEANDNKPDKSVYVEVMVGNKKFVLATFTPETLPIELIDLEFEEDVKIWHNLTRGSVYLCGMQLNRRVHKYPLSKADRAKEEARLASECAHLCGKFKSQEFWVAELKNGEPFDVQVNSGCYLVLRQVSLIVQEFDKEAAESVCVEVVDKGRKYELAMLHTRSKPQKRIQRLFTQNFQILNNFKDGVVNVLGTLTTEHNYKTEKKIDSTATCFPEYEVGNEESGRIRKRSRTSEEGAYTDGLAIDLATIKDASENKGNGEESSHLDKVVAELHAMRVTKEAKVVVMKEKFDFEQKRELTKEEWRTKKMHYMHLNTLLAKKDLSPEDEDLKGKLLGMLYGK